MALSTDKAARISRWMLLVVIIGAVFCVGVFAIGLKTPRVTAPVLEPRDFNRQHAAAGGNDSVAAHTDWIEAAELLSWMVPESVTRGLVDGRPNATDEQPVEPAENLAQTQNRSGRNVPPDWRYVGYFGDPENFMALVTMGGQQRVIQVGQEIDGFKFTKIQPELILLASGNDELKLTAAAPSAIELDLPLRSATPKPRRSGRTEDYERFQDRRQFWKTDESEEKDPS